MQSRDSEIVSCVQQILDQLRRVMEGKDEQLLWTLAAILAREHILLEDIPGVGKTTMALSFARTLDLEYGRVQFTPDVLPSDITGYCIPEPQTGQLRYHPGAVLCNLFLADELNRATSRTQSALLEAMEEGQVTVDGVTHELPRPFVVIATQNPLGAAGTQRLPDSQVDRFTLRLRLGYPDPASEMAMIRFRQNGNPLDQLRPVLTRERLLALQQLVEKTYLSDSVIRYAVELIGATRRSELLSRGASPRATLSVVAMARAIAQLRGRDYVVPGDIREVFAPTVAHRLMLSAKAESLGKTAEDVVGELLEKQAVPPLC